MMDLTLFFILNGLISVSIGLACYFLNHFSSQYDNSISKKLYRHSDLFEIGTAFGFFQLGIPFIVVLSVITAIKYTIRELGNKLDKTIKSSQEKTQ